MEKLKNIDLSKRERRILKIVIEDYINGNRPIGSAYLKNHYDFAFSPATIRNSMAKLEHCGLLSHRHTSSGRIPTDLGYRYYVNELLDDSEQSITSGNIEENLLNLAANVDDLMQATAFMMAKISGLFGVVVVSEVRKSILTEIELVSLASDRLMMVIALKSGLLRSLVFNLDIIITAKELNTVNQILRERLIGLSVEAIQNSIKELLLNNKVPNHEIIQVIFNHPLLPYNLFNNNKLYLSSYQEILAYPEFQEIDILQKTMSGLEEANIKELFSRQLPVKETVTIIGEESQNKLLSHCSVLATRFESDSISGKLGILGPTRIPYKNIHKILKEFVEIMPNVC